MGGVGGIYNEGYVFPSGLAGLMCAGRACRTIFYIKFTQKMCVFVLIFNPSIMFKYRSCRAKSDFSARARLNIGFFSSYALAVFGSDEETSISCRVCIEI